MFIRLRAWWSCTRLSHNSQAFYMGDPWSRRLTLRILYWDWRKHGATHDEALLYARRHWRIKARGYKTRLETNRIRTDLIQELSKDMKYLGDKQVVTKTLPPTDDDLQLEIQLAWEQLRLISLRHARELQQQVELIDQLVNQAVDQDLRQACLPALRPDPGKEV